jgi:hypothetical protein
LTHWLLQVFLLVRLLHRMSRIAFPIPLIIFLMVDYRA